MLFDILEDYGLILLALAAFGFMVSDAFKMGRYWGIPIYRNDIEKVFHYISNAITAIIVIFVMFLYFLINYPKNLLIENFGTYIQKVGITENILIGLFYFTFIYIIFYIFAIGVGFWLSTIFHYIKALWINVYLIDNKEPKKFAGFITESKDFFFFQKNELLWEAIRKDQIVRIETIQAKGRINEDWDTFHSRFIEIYPRFTEYLHNLYLTIKTFIYPKQ